jgi:putative oxidoreductase
MENSALAANTPNRAVMITGRVLFTLIFFLSGIGHFTQMKVFVGLMPAAIPAREFWVITSALVELAGATMIVTGKYVKAGAWLIALFLVPVTLTVHGVGMLTETDPVMQGVQTSMFLKGLAMLGAALLFTQFAPVAAGSVRSAS